MPSLNDLQLNRWIKKDNQNLDTTDVGSSMFGDINNNQGNTSTIGSNGSASGLQPGSLPVQGTLIQSSGSNERVEINPDDSFYAYNGGTRVVTINKDGINADNIVVQTLISVDTTTDTLISVDTTTDTLAVTDTITYRGTRQPVLFSGVINANGTVIVLPTGWSCTRNSIGNYTITHNLNTLIPFIITLSPISGHFRSSQFNRTSNSFDVSWQQTSYGSVTVPVTGGGGGSVTVSGVRIAPGEEPVDVQFQFMFMQNL